MIGSSSRVAASAGLSAGRQLGTVAIGEIGGHRLPPHQPARAGVGWTSSQVAGTRSRPH
jgi:hypothetical protein